MSIKVKRPTSILLILCVVLSLFAGSAYAAHRYFEDAKGHWAEEAINILAEKGVIAGYPDGLVHPDNIITRAEFAALITRTMELPKPSGQNITIRFTDIAGHWSESDVEALILAGIIQKGDFNDKFLPDEPITRMEMIRMLVRAMGKESHDPFCPCMLGFSDESQLSGEEKAYICTGKHYHIIDGYPDGTVRPDKNATRGEAFEMLVDTEKAKEQIKKEEGEKPPVIKPEEKPSSSGGSSYVPAPQFSFSLPETAYSADEIKVEANSRYVSSIIWTVQKDGLPAVLTDIIKGELTADGGTVQFLQTGSFTLTATAKNSRGVTANYEQAITVYPMVSVDFKLPETAHTDTAVVVELSAENLGSNTAVWSLEKDGAAVETTEALAGELNSQGGTVLFKEKGIYTLTAAITDELGKTVKASDTITVYPLAEVKLELPAVSHTDKTIVLQTETKETDDLTVAYTLTRNGESADITTFVEGNLTHESIRFKEKGVYTLTASVTDITGRVFADTATITIYPVGSAGFYLPEIFHTDKTVTVEAVFDEIDSHRADWSLIRNGKEIPLSYAATGTLTNSGGNLQFKEKGSYLLKAKFTDDGDRSYSYEQSFKVYPVPDISYSLPRHAHTDTDIAVETDIADLDGLAIEWLVDNTYGFQDWGTYVDESLANSGGTIRFKRAGVYELVARVTDETGRVFLFESGSRCEVLPVLTIGFELPELAYTDTAIDLRTSGNNNVLPVEWTAKKDGKNISLSEAFSGNLNAQGGKITFKAHGEYVLTAAMTDYLGRSYTNSQRITILPVVQYAFTIPETIHYGTSFTVVSKDAQHIEGYTAVWMLKKDDIDAVFQGSLDNSGGSISIHDVGTFMLTATITDSAGRAISYFENITVTNTPPDAPTVTSVPTRTVKDGKFFVEIKANATDPDGDAVTMEYDSATADGHYAPGTHIIRVRAKDIAGAYSAWTEKSFTITSSAPTVTLTATHTRTAKDGKFFVDITAVAIDADGDPTTLEWENKTADNYYTVGTHTIRVRAKDSTGVYSEWASRTFIIANSAPTTPVITRTPSGNSVAPGTPVTIKATSSDPDGDAVTLVWENRNAEIQAYPLGRNLVRVKAVDTSGAESPWAAIVFFVADSNGSGGMTLTGPDSVILENGLEGATITEYTFTVPPVSGHSGSDFGRVRGLNKLTGQWDQLDYGTTSNGITFSRTLGAGVYTQLEFYYYTNHNCMYNKSNITYSVTYHFE